MTMKGRREELKGGHEYDAVSRFWRHCIHWKPGALRLVKRKINKRARQVSKFEIRKEFEVK